MGIQLLGPLTVEGQEELSRRDRVVLAALVVHRGSAVSTERLADALWGDAPPPSAAKVVQGCVLRLRRSLGAGAVVTVAGGYRLDVAADEVDVYRFEALARRGHALAEAGAPGRAATVLAEALSLWRGPPLADLDHWHPGRVEALRLVELRSGVEERLVEVDLARGREAVAAAQALVREQPLRERRWWLLALALYRAGRQAEALAAVREARTILREELGLDPGHELADLEQAVLRHDPGLDPPDQAGEDLGLCPYKGLLAYQSEDQEWFFGRDREAETCLRALADAPLLVVAGPSGSGKSSLVRAALVPALQRRTCRVAVLTPSVDPDAGLTAALAGADVDVLVVDQFEELFTAGHAETVVTGYLERLAALASAGTRVIAVLRADHVGELSACERFARLAEQGLHLVTPMTDAEVRSAVEGPARQAGLQLEAGLTDLLLREVQGEPGSLPLLSHALAQTWERREGGVLTVEGYRATGGIAGAVAQSAERLHESLSEPEREVLRDLMLRLVSPSEDGDAVVNRVATQSLLDDAEAAAVLDQLVRLRLVTTDGSSVGVAHAALVRAWPRLRSWLDDDVEGQRTRRHLTLAAADWDATGRPESELYRGARLSAALAWRLRDHPRLTVVEQAFLDTSAARREAEGAEARRRSAEQARQNRRLRLALVASLVAFALAVSASLVAQARGREAERTSRAAQLARLVADSIAARGSRRDLSALLAMHAHRLQPDAASRAALFGVFTAAPGFLGYRHLDTPLTSAHYLPDGETLVAARRDGNVVLLRVSQPGDGPGDPGDPGDPDARDTLAGPRLASDGARAAVSNDGRTLATIAWQGDDRRGGLARLLVTDLPARRARLPELRLPFDVGSVAVSPDGRFVAVSGHGDGRALVLDVPALAPAAAAGLIDLGTPHPAVERVVGLGAGTSVRRTAPLAFDSRGRLLLGTPVGVLRVVEPSTGRQLGRFARAPAEATDRGVAVTQDGSVVVSSGRAGLVAWNARTARPLWVVRLGAERCEALALSPVTRSVLCADALGGVQAFDVATGAPGRRYDLQLTPASALAISPDGRELVEVGAVAPLLGRWRLDGSGAVARVLGVEGDPSAFSPDGRLLAVDGPGTVRAGEERRPRSRIVDVASGTVVRDLGALVVPVWTERSGTLVAWRGENPVLVDLATGRPGLWLEGGPGTAPLRGQVARHGRHFVAWISEGRARLAAVWDVRTGRLLGVTQRPGWSSAWLTRDGSRLLVAGERGLVALAMGAGDPSPGDRAVTVLAGSPSGRLVGGTAVGRLFRIDPATLRPVGPALPSSSGPVEHLALSDDGRLLLARSSDGGARLVDVDAGVQLGDAVDVRPYGTWAVLRPDGTALAVPGPSGVAVWQLDVRAWEAAACRVAGRGLTPEEWRTHVGDLAPYRPGCSPSG